MEHKKKKKRNDDKWVNTEFVTSSFAAWIKTQIGLWVSGLLALLQSVLLQKSDDSVFEGLFFLKLGNLAVLSLTLAQSQKNREEHCASMSDTLKGECHIYIKLISSGQGSCLHSSICP